VAHFAELDEENFVTRLIRVSNSIMLDQEGVEQESLGVSFCQGLFGGRWVQTSYNGTHRKNYAGVGYIYDTTRDAFIAPQPYESWALDEDTCTWIAPIPYPEDGTIYRWDESTTSWV